MECMNSLILHLTDAQHRNHQVRTWTKQVVGLTRDCGGNVELYLQYVGGGESTAGQPGGGGRSPDAGVSQRHPELGHS
ncbi:hypothetical protein ACP4OV_002253 [Aristida adscensionis]